MHKKFEGAPGYSVTRMTWIKPNFLWMQFRSGWSTKENQERCLAIKLKRSYFDYLVNDAVLSNELDRAAVEKSNVRLQWDPDHYPNGERCERRAMQIGVRRTALEPLVNGDMVLDIVDITDDLVKPQREAAGVPKRWSELIIPIERIYMVGTSTFEH
jgi:hypothetical protein